MRRSRGSESLGMQLCLAELCSMEIVRRLKRNLMRE